MTLVVVLRSGGDGDAQAGGPVSPSTSATGKSAAPTGSGVPADGGAATSTSVGSTPIVSTPAGGRERPCPRQATSVTPAAGYTDGTCPPGDGAQYAVIDLTSATSVPGPGEQGPSVTDTLTACVTSTVRPRLSLLYGRGFNAPDDDHTGGGTGTVARYRMVSDSGGILTITLVRTPDDRYVCTAFAYQPA